MANVVDEIGRFDAAAFDVPDFTVAGGSSFTGLLRSSAECVDVVPSPDLLVSERVLLLKDQIDDPC